ncbi:3-oxoacyl-[acyl-carrier-protein] synthase III C-terminal domain-containing protein [Haliangium sp.]|uniref:3-oxoacyl-[acyl-carrier-protein] synthase III C-terminal domain-containing protein n=1 Tax=Haliangium sp. TaxID=2663208 RepID=UPI003D152664
MSNIYLSGLAYELGEERAPITDLPELIADEDACDLLLALGLDEYVFSSRTPPQLAQASLDKTLAQVQVDRTDIDVLLYASSSLWDRAFYTKEIGALCCALDLPHAMAIGVHLAECGNLASALRVAAGMVRSGDADNVLLVTADQPAPDSKRLVDPVLSVLSDGAASCLVSSRRGDYELVGLRQGARQDLWNLDLNAESVKRMRSFTQGLGKTALEVLAAAEMTAEDVDCLICNNYTFSVLRAFADRVKIPTARLFTDNVAQTAHVFSADNLINLVAARASGRIEPNQRVMALSTGQCSWSASLLRAT